MDGAQSRAPDWSLRDSAWMEKKAPELIDTGATLFVFRTVCRSRQSHRPGHRDSPRRPILDDPRNCIFQSANGRDRYGPLTWQSAVVDGLFAGGRLSAVRMKPLVLAADGEARGNAFLAESGAAAVILGRLADRSTLRHRATVLAGFVRGGLETRTHPARVYLRQVSLSRQPGGL